MYLEANSAGSAINLCDLQHPINVPGFIIYLYLSSEDVDFIMTEKSSFML